MERVVLVAALKPDARQQALALVESLEPTSVGDAIPERAGIFLSDREAVFFFEGAGTVESIRALVNDPVRSTLLSPWLPLFEGPLHLAREAFFFARPAR